MGGWILGVWPTGWDAVRNARSGAVRLMLDRGWRLFLGPVYTN